MGSLGNEPDMTLSSDQGAWFLLKNEKFFISFLRRNQAHLFTINLATMTTRGALSDLEHMTLFRAMRIFAVNPHTYGTFLDFLISEERETIPIYLQDLLSSDLHEKAGLSELYYVLYGILSGDTCLERYLDEFRKLISPNFQDCVTRLFEIYDAEAAPITAQLNKLKSENVPWKDLAALENQFDDIWAGKAYRVSEGEQL